MNFREYFGHKVIEEITQDKLEHISTNVKNLLERKVLPFNSIFGDKLRIMEPLNGGMQYVVDINNAGDGQYNFDLDQWVGYKVSDVDKKNPVRIGKILHKRKTELEKMLQSAQAGQQTIDPQQIQSALDGVNRLLSTTNLQSQYKQSQTTSLYMIYSRAPVDVVRMGDFKWRYSSCHAPDGDYFSCALADASQNAGVIYLIDEEDVEINGLNDDANLQADEIFMDNDRDLDGINPLARMRIRMVLDQDGHQLAVPTTKIYARPGNEFNNDFIEQSLEWARKQDTSQFEWDHVLTLRGGSYEDAGYSIEQQVKKIWGKNIRYKAARDEDDFSSIQDNVFDDQEEHFWDNVRQQLTDSEERDIFDPLFNNADWQENSGLAINIRHGQGIDITFAFSDEMVETIKSQKQGQIDPYSINERINGTGWRLSFSNRRGRPVYELVTSVESPNIYDFGDFYGDHHGNFDATAYNTECQTTITDALESFAPVLSYRKSWDLAIQYRASFANKIFDLFGINDGLEPEKTVDEIVDAFIDKDFPSEQMIMDGLIVPTLEGIDISTVNINGQRKTVEFGEQDTQTITYVATTVINWIWEKIKQQYGVLEGKNSVTLDYMIYLPSNDVEFTKYRMIDHKGDKIQITTTDGEEPLVSVLLKNDVHLETEVITLIDSNELYSVYNLLESVENMDDDEKDRMIDIDGLDQVLQSAGLRVQDDELRGQGQTDLDLSSVNRNMKTFDSFIQHVFENLAARGPAVKPSGGPDMPSSSGASPASGGVKPTLGAASATPTSSTATPTNAQGPDYLSLISDPKTFEAFRQNPEQVQGFKSYMADPQNVQAMTSQIKDPNVMNSIISLMSQQ